MRLGVIRTVDEARLEDQRNWGDELDLALETEFWDLIGNSDHARYPAWHSKAKAYVAANVDADPRLGMLISAGAVFSLTRLFQNDDPLEHLAEYSDFIADATVGIRDAIEPLGDHMFHGTEGRAAAPFTHGMVNDPEYVDYGIALMEGCNNWICNWTSKLAPFKPIGQLMTLAELHAIRASTAADSGVRAVAYEEMNSLLDRAAMLAAARDYPYPGAGSWSAKPGPPAFKSEIPQTCD